jgi:hypothetical protein
MLRRALVPALLTTIASGPVVPRPVPAREIDSTLAHAIKR